MDDTLLIVLIAALFALGFIPVAALLKYLGKNRRYTSEQKDRPERKPIDTGKDPVEEFDRTGMLYFDPEDEGK